MVTVLPAMSDAQTVAWHALMELHERLPDSWTLIGGQMVHLHCSERGVAPVRTTDDADALLNVKHRPTILFDFTQGLHDAGFRPTDVTPEGHQHRWVKGEAQIDVLIGDRLGQRGAADRKGITGSTTLGTPGAARVLARSESIEIAVGDRVGHIRRPTLLGALIAKAAAHSVGQDSGRDRHRNDFAVLASLTTAADLRAQSLSRAERRYLANMIEAVDNDAAALETVPGAAVGVRRTATVLTTP